MVLAKISLTFISSIITEFVFFCSAFVYLEAIQDTVSIKCRPYGHDRGDKGGGLLDGQVKQRRVRIGSPFQWKGSVGMRIDVLKKNKNINLSPLRLLPEFVKVVSGNQAHIVSA
jgi:hypothetical protein